MNALLPDVLRFLGEPIPALVVKTTLVLLAGGAVSLLLRRQAAATRHDVWLLTLAATLIVAIPTPKDWRFDLPVATWTTPPPAPSTWVGDDGSESLPSQSPKVVAPPPIWETSPARAGLPVPPLGYLWLLGALLVIAWHALGHWGIGRLAKSAAPVRDARWLALVPDTVGLRSSDAVGSPLVCGVMHPTILLPVEAADWTEERRRVVVLHELAHVARGDALSQTLASLACVVWWFHPGVWLAARRMRAESERACDDRVVAAGVSALDYASHLLGVARTARALRLAGAVAITMARRSTLEGRLLAMLDGKRRTGAATRGARVMVATVLMLVLAAITLVRPVARPVAASTSKSSQSSRSDDKQSSFRDVIDAKSGETLVLDLETGGRVTVRSWNQNQVQVNGTLSGKDWERTQTHLGRDGNRVVFSSLAEDDNSGSFSTDHRFEFQVPSRFNVKIRSAGGSVTLIGLEGDMIGNTGGGGITMRQLKGHANLSTGGGNIDVDDVNMSGRVSTGGGKVKLSRVSGGLRGTSGSGPVIQADPDDDDAGDGDLEGVQIDASDIKLAGRTQGGRLRIDRAGGEIKIDQAPDGVIATTGGGQVTIGPSAKKVHLSTGGGEIEVGPAKGSVEAGTGAGDIHVVLANSSEPDREVSLTSGKGTVVIELERGVGVDLDLETAYTDGFGRKTQIRSDVPVDIDVSDDWDTRHGTPRKYVRAKATHGDGSVHVTVRTVNGDIWIKRK